MPSFRQPAPTASPAYSILNAPASEPPAAASRASDDAPVTVASAAGSMASTPPQGSATSKPQQGAKPAASCRVWTASYGGQKALIIRVRSDKGTDFTVLDVNEGAEKREAEAYIAAYAKGGAIEAEFGNQSQALEKAFELCPEG